MAGGDLDTAHRMMMTGGKIDFFSACHTKVNNVDTSVQNAFDGRLFE